MHKAIASNPSGKPDTAKDCSEKEAPSGKRPASIKWRDYTGPTLTRLSTSTLGMSLVDLSI